VNESRQDQEEGKEGPPNLQFELIKEWLGEETIVAVQWLVHQVSLSLF
jgi:hypothetical protein